MISSSLKNKSDVLQSPDHGNRQGRAFYKRGLAMPKQIKARGKNGVYYANFWMNGVQYQDKLVDKFGRGTNDEKWAERFLAELKSRIERGDYKKFKIKFSDLTGKYLNEISTKSESIQDRARYALKPLSEFFGDVRVVLITKKPTSDPETKSVVDYKEWRERQGRQESTIKKELRVLAGIMRLVDESWKNPTATETDQMKFRNKGRQVKRFLREDDVLAIADRVPFKCRIPCLISAYSGLRLNDVVGPTGLCQNDIGSDGFILRKQGKTGVDVKIPFRGNKKLQAVIAAIRIRPMDPGTPFFADLDPRTVSSSVRSTCRRIGYPWASFRSFRHFAASQLLRCGVNLKTIQNFMGHEDFRSTQVYLHADDEDLQAAGAAFEVGNPVQILCK